MLNGFIIIWASIAYSARMSLILQLKNMKIECNLTADRKNNCYDHNLNNIQPCCITCNQMKSDRDVECDNEDKQVNKKAKSKITAKEE
jgi:hypothetical protein